MSNPRQWYALHVRPGAEFRVGDALKKCGHTYLIPYVKRKVRHGTATGDKNKHDRRIPIFARYVFFAFAEAPKWDDVKAIEPKPVRTISFDGVPATLTQSEMTYIANLRELPKPAEVGKITAGILAKIIEGPFATIPGKFRVQDVDADGRAGVDVPMIGAPRRVRIPVGHLVAA